MMGRNSRRTDAILWRPGFCSSASVAPKAFCMIAHRPKNSRDLEKCQHRNGAETKCYTHPFQYALTVFRCAFLIAPTSNSQQYCHLSAHSCTYPGTKLIRKTLESRCGTHTSLINFSLSSRDFFPTFVSETMGMSDNSPSCNDSKSSLTDFSTF